jgi:hypothetical protein
MRKKIFIIYFFLLYIGSFAAQAQNFATGDRLEVLSEKDGKWYSATIKAIQEDNYLISYDGYASSYDQVIPFSSSRLRKANTEIEGVKSYIKVNKGQTTSFKGNIKEGEKITLNWAALSNMACFPATRFVEFEGNHLFYWVDLPVRSEMYITVKPLNGKRINVYAYSGFDGSTLPPDVVSCVSCEAGYEKWSAMKTPKNFQKSAGNQTIRLNAINNPYRVLIGVAGAKGVLEGDFELTISVR